MTLFLFLSALALMPQAAAPTPATESSDREIVAAMKAFGAAADEVVTAQVELTPLIRKALGSLRSEKDALAASEEIRPLLARLRTRLVRSGTAAAAIRPVVFPPDMPVTFDRLRADFLDQNRAMLRLLDGIDGVFAAAVTRNRADLERHLTEVTQGAVTLVAAQVTILRGRQAAVPTNESAHQSIGVFANLYEAMAVLVGLRSNARFDGEQPVARLKRLTASTRSLSEAGRANLARELKVLGDTPQRSTERAVVAAEAEVFALGDQMADTFAEMSAGALTPDRAASFQAWLTDLETRFQQITSRQLAAMPTP